MKNLGQEMFNTMENLFPICRSITGNGVRQTLKIISNDIPLKIHEVPTGTNCFDWNVPKEWNIRDAFVADKNGKKIIDFQKCNLHVVGYSVPIDKWVDLIELKKHLHSLPEQPDAIPYVTSYYNENWGFCMAHDERLNLKEGKYHVHIDSSLKNGSMTYGECIIPGEKREEVFLSTYICHPSMANNELSGPVIAKFIAKWINSKPRKYSYRLIFIPETIGSIYYLSKHLNELKKNVVAGFNISCIGDNNNYSYVASRNENSYADRVAYHVLSKSNNSFVKYSFLDRGSDERQYCSPGIDLPVVTLCRSKFGAYPEYHTSLDNLNLVSVEGLYGGYKLVKDSLRVIENNNIYKPLINCEPKLGKYGLYSSGIKNPSEYTKLVKNLIAYIDGEKDLLWIAEKINCKIFDLLDIVKKLIKFNIIDEIIMDD